MRIPIPDGPRVQSRPISTPYSSVNHDTGLKDLAQGAGQFVAGFERAKHEESVLAEKAREQASIVASNDAQAEFERREAHLNSAVKPEVVGYEAPPVEGYLQTRGADASRHGAKAQEWLEKQQKDIEEKLATPEAKAIFRKRSGDYLLQARRRMQGHETAQVEEAKVASNAALMDMGLRSVRANYADEDLATQIYRDRSGALHALARSPQEGFAQSMAWQAKVAEARVDAALDADDWQTAERIYEKHKDVIGDGGRMAKAINEKRSKATAERSAQVIVEQATDKTGRVDPDKVAEYIDELPENIRDEARTRAEHRMMRKEQAWKKETDAIGTAAFTAWNEANGDFSKIPDKLLQQLNERDPQLYAQLKDKSRALFDRWKKHKNDDAGARRAQAYENEVLLNRFQSMPKAEQQATDIDAWLAKQSEAPDKLGIEKLKKARQFATERVEKGNAEAEEAFMQDARAAGIANKAAKGKEEGGEYLADARREYDAFVTKHGREPTKAEAAAIIADLAVSKEIPRKILGFDAGKRALPGWRLKQEKRARAKELKAQGKSTREIAETLTSEGY